MTMDDQTIKTLALLAGLDIALEQFPEDVAAAAASALSNLESIQFVTDAAVEPWPPMRAGAAS